MTTPVTPFSVVSVARTEESWKPSLKARAKVRLADAVVVELEVLEGRNGAFIVYPSRREKRHGQDAWCALVEIVDPELQKSVFAALRKEYARLEERAKAAAAPEPEPQIDPSLPPADDLPF